MVILIHGNLIQFPTILITRPEEELNCQSSMESEQAVRIKEMKDEQRNFLQMMDFSYPTIFPQTQMSLGQSLDQEKNLEGPSVNPFRVPDLDDPYEQEKLNKGSSSQLNDIESQQMYNSLKQRLKAVEDKNILKGLNPNDLSLVPAWSYHPALKCQVLKSMTKLHALRCI